LGKITALRASNHGEKVKVFVDGVLAFVADKKTIANAGLQLGQNLSVSQVEEIKHLFLLHDCVDAALHYLSYRPRSKDEVRRRLQQRGFADDVIVETMDTLKERGFIDDVAFANFWKDSRLSFNPRSRELLKLELRQKGVSAHIAAETVEDIDDETSAYRVGLKKSRGLGLLDYADFRRRIFGYLRRRGFGYEVANKVVERLWNEREVYSV